MGKTSLAVRAAYDCTPDQFQRIIFVSVKDRELDDDGERKLTGFILPGFLQMLNDLLVSLSSRTSRKLRRTSAFASCSMPCDQRRYCSSSTI